MSVLTAHLASQFFLAGNDEPQALAAMKAFVADESRCPTNYVLDPDAVKAATDLVTALAAAGLEAARDCDRDIVSLRWTGERLPYDVETLRALLTSFTRFVKKGSYLAVEENGERCLLTFQKTRVKLAREEEVDDEAHSTFEDAERFYRRGDLDTALPIFEDAIALAGNHTEARWYELAWTRRLWILYQRGRWAELVAVAARAPETHRDVPTDTLTELHGENEAAFDALLDTILAADPTNEIALEYRRERRGA